MREGVVALVYVVAIGFVAFRLTSGTFGQIGIIDRRKMALFVFISSMGFVVAPLTPAPSVVFYLGASLAILALKEGDPVRQVGVFLFLIPLVPSLDDQLAIGGLPLIDLNWQRAIAILLLLPLIPTAVRAKSLIHYRVDKYFWAVFIVSVLIGFRDTTFTNGLRVALGLAVDFSPYFVVSRVLRSSDDIRAVFMPFVAALAFAALLNTFETIRSWSVYAQLVTDISGFGTATADRAGFHRAFGALDRPSQSAFALATGIGLLWGLSSFARSRMRILMMLALMSAGLVATFSRGSWVGAVLIGMGYLVTNNLRNLLKLAVIGAVIAVPIMFLPITQEIIRVLPFVGEEGTQAADTVSYRQELFTAAITVANENPLFGSTDFSSHPELDRLRLASGLLDLVNHYAILMLSMGYVGLVTFLAVFASTLWGLLRALRNVGLYKPEDRDLIKALMFTITGLLVAIGTTSLGAKGGVILWCLVAAAAVMTKPAVSGSRVLRTTESAQAKVGNPS